MLTVLKDTNWLCFQWGSKLWFNLNLSLICSQFKHPHYIFSPHGVVGCFVDVIIFNITITQECEGVRIEWMSPPVSSYWIRVNCNGIWCFNTNTSSTSIFLSLKEFAGLANCTAYVSAITTVGLGPEEDKAISFYTSEFRPFLGCLNCVLNLCVCMCMHSLYMCVCLYGCGCHLWVYVRE